MKKIILVAAILAMAAGCGKNKVTPVIPNAERVKLDPSTVRPGRAAEATILAMESDPNGFAVWAVANGVTGWWDGTAGASHIYTDGIWNFDPAKQWPSGTDSFPMDFYAVFPLAQAGLGMNADPALQTLAADFTVQSTAATQADLLGGKATANIKPAGGSISITFHHLLSKINFGMNLGDTFMISVQGLALNNVGDNGVYTFTGTTPEWTSAPATYTSAYDYYGRIYPSPTGNPTATPLPAPEFTGNDSAVTMFYTALTDPTADDANLMLMPQSAPGRTWGAGSAPTAAPASDVSYVGMVYRLTQGGHDLIGMTQAQTHPGFAGSALAASGYPATAPLFVKAGYPFDLIWVSGKGYNYNISFNGDDATGGYLLDQYHYDRYGNRTDLVVSDVDGDGDPDGIEVPDPLLDGDEIHLVPVVTDWDEETADVN